MVGDVAPARALSGLQNKLAWEIHDWLRSSGLEADAHISEARLAERFTVSRSPVRSALNVLVAEGILRKEPNRGYFLSVPSASLDEGGIGLAPSEEEELYRAIVADRIGSRLPDQLSEADFLRKYDARRGLLLRVLNRFAEDGIMQRAPGHGWRFLPALLSEDAHDESYRFRLLVEPAAFDEQSFAIDAAALAACRGEHEALLRSATVSAAELFRVNTHFHEMIAAFSGNRYLLQAVQTQNRLRRLLEVKGAANAKRVQQSCAEHLEIIEALEQGDRQLAQVLLRRHLTIASRLKLAFAQ